MFLATWKEKKKWRLSKLTSKLLLSSSSKLNDPFYRVFIPEFDKLLIFRAIKKIRSYFNRNKCREEDVTEEGDDKDDKTTNDSAAPLTIEVGTWITKQIPKICLMNSKGLKKSNWSLPVGSARVG